MFELFLTATGAEGLPTPIVIALSVGIATSVLAVLVSLLLARHMRAIGDAGERRENADEPQEQ